jgi:hypothetical protein
MIQERDGIWFSFPKSGPVIIGSMSDPGTIACSIRCGRNRSRVFDSTIDTPTTVVAYNVDDL